MTLDHLKSRLGGCHVANSPNLSLYERTEISDIECFVYDPVLCLILQGGKVTRVTTAEVHLRPGDALVVSHHLPVVSRITQASAAAPYKALILRLDLSLVRRLAEFIVEDTESAPPPLVAASLSEDLLEALARYIALHDDPLDAEVLGPAHLRELHYRVLRSPLGVGLRRLLTAGAPATRIDQAIARLRAAFDQPISVAELADLAAMSQSSFHVHFKAVTGSTPLQYQKDLRLIEAMGRLSDGRETVGTVAFSVGYESATQFSREFKRKFGRSPRDIRLPAAAA